VNARADLRAPLPETPRPPSIVRVADVADLSAVFDDATNVVILRRALPPDVAEDVARAVAEPGLGFVAPIAPTPSGASLLERALPRLVALAADIAFYCEVLQELTGSAVVGVRLARLAAPMCPRMHVDKVQLRLVCTYAGPGTELLASEDADRRGLGHPAGDVCSGLVRPGGHVQGTTAGDVVLLKGEAWPGNAGRGAVHRSPAMVDSAPRLVLTLDPL
jgi:hypothetical protein